MFPPEPKERRAPLSAAEIGLLHKVDHVLTVALEREFEQSLEETRPILPVPEPRPAHYMRSLPQTGPLSHTGPLRAQ